MSIFRNRFVWIGLILIVLAGGGFVFMQSQAKASKLKAEQAKTAAAAAADKSPYVAIANGKADVEGGIIQVAARRAGVIRQVLVQEGDDVVSGQVLARLEDDEPRLAADRAAAEVSQAKAQIALLQVERSTAQARLNEARYDQELSVIRAPADGRIVRRYANPGAGASTLNVSNMFDLEPRADRIVRAEIAEGALPNVAVGQRVQLAPESDPSKTYSGQVLRRAAVFGARKLQSDDPNERTDDRVVEVVVATDNAPFLIGQRVLVKFMRQQQASVPAAPKS